MWRRSILRREDGNVKNSGRQCSVGGGGVWFILGVGTRRCLIVFARFYEARSLERIIRRSVRCACLYYTNRSGISFVYISISTRNDARHGTKFDVDGSVFEHRAYFVSGEFLFIDCKKQPSSFAFTFNQLQSDCSRIFWFRIFIRIFTRRYPRILLSMHRNPLFVLSEKKYEFLRIHGTRARGEKLGIETCVIQNW